jgi:Protein of unknown function (DUF3551)
MRTLVIVLILGTSAFGTHASAQSGLALAPWYPWCAIDGDNRSGGQRRSCGFVSYEQCRNAVRGGTDICAENIWGGPPAQVSRPDEARPRRR